MDDLAFDFDRNMIATAKICIETSSEHLRQHARHISTTMHPTHKARMGITSGERKNVTHELVMDRDQIHWTGRSGLMEAGADAIWDRLPHRAFTNMLDVVEDIVEHPMPLGSGTLPI